MKIVLSEEDHPSYSGTSYKSDLGSSQSDFSTQSPPPKSVGLQISSSVNIPPGPIFYLMIPTRWGHGDSSMVTFIT